MKDEFWVIPLYFPCVLTSRNLSAMVKKLTCFIFSFCINYSRHLTLKQQKNLHKGLFIQIRSEDKSLYRFSHLVNVTCFCIYVEKNIFCFISKHHEELHKFLQKKKFFLLSHSQSVSTICVIFSVTILHGCFYCVFFIEVLLVLYRKAVSRECFGIQFEKSP